MHDLLFVRLTLCPSFGEQAHETYTLQAIMTHCISRIRLRNTSRVDVFLDFTVKDLQPVINEMLVHATTQLPQDTLNAIKEAHVRETKDLAKEQLEAILTSANLSELEKLPLCQDTGLVTLFISG